MKEFIRFIKFAFFSLSAGLVEIGSFTLFKEVINLPYWLCYMLALILSVVWNFTFNRKFTFKSSNNIPIAMLKVFAFYLVFTPLSTVFGNFLVSKKINEYLVTIINMLLNFILEFFYQRYYVFKDSLDTNIKKS